MAVGAGIGSYGTSLGSVNVPCEGPPDLGLIERSIGVVTGLQLLHAKLGYLRDKIEGNGACGKDSPPCPAGLEDQFSESESVLRACHSLLDDILGKF